MYRSTRPPESNDVRPPAVAGLFYSADPVELQGEIADLLRRANRAGPIPQALIVPHAGYRYSGPVAASAYALLEPLRPRIRRVVLLGPCHRVPFQGLAASSANAFATPLGEVPLDRQGVETSLKLPQVQLLDEAHRREHSLEVQLPLLQTTLDEFSLVPFAMGEATTQEVAAVIEALWTAEDTLIVISSDLSHYLDYRTAQAIDEETAKLIEAGAWHSLSGEQACGFRGIQGLLSVAQQRHLQVETIDLRNSGDITGRRERVVGYGSFAVH